MVLAASILEHLTRRIIVSKRRCDTLNYKPPVTSYIVPAHFRSSAMFKSFFALTLHLVHIKSKTLLQLHVGALFRLLIVESIIY